MSDLYSKNSDKGGEGVKNPENLADVICEWPLMPHVNALPSEMCANPPFRIHKVAHSHLATLPPRSDLKQSILMLIFQNATLEEKLTSKSY